jgi:hypothetical protein
MDHPIPNAQPHGDLTEVLPDVFMVTGSMKFGPTRFSRNMVVVREGERLVLLNTVRLDDAGLAALDALGKVTDVLRLAGFHGSDDRFYKGRYDARVWAMRGARYFSGIDPKKGVEYLTADAWLDVGGEVPLAGASVYRIDTEPPEGLLRIPAGGGTLISGDSLQNWGGADRFFNLAGRALMTASGFLKPHQLGPGWIKALKPDPAQIAGVLDLDFANLLPAHGAPVLGDALACYRPAIDAYVAKAR